MGPTGPEGGGDVKKYIDQITKWIPGDILAIYAAGVTIVASRSQPAMDVGWLVAAAIAAPVLVVLSAWSAGAMARAHWVKAGLAFVAFLVWSVTIPSGGWQQLDVIKREPGIVAVVAGLVGLLFGLFAEGAARRWAR